MYNAFSYEVQSKLPDNMKPQLIIQQKSSAKSECLTIFQDPRYPIWIPKSELIYQYQELLDEFSVAKSLFRNDMIQPVAVLHIQNLSYYQFRFPLKDIFVLVEDAEKIQQKRTIQEPKFNIALQHLIKQFDQDLMTLWSNSISLESAIYYLIKYFRKQVIVFTQQNYYRLAQTLFNLGITSAYNMDYDAQVIIQQDFTYSIKVNSSQILISSLDKQYNGTVQCQKLVITENSILTSFQSQFLGISSQLENYHLENILQTQQQTVSNKNIGSSSRILYSNLSLIQQIESKEIFQLHPLSQKLFSEVRSKNDTFTNSQFIGYNTNLCHQFLKVQQTLEETSGKKDLLDKLRIGLSHIKIFNYIVIVPNYCYDIVLSYYQQQNISINLDLENQQHSTTILTDSQLISYLKVTQMKGAFINPTYLAKFVIFPFISTRLTEIYVEQLYQLHDISIPFIYILITLLSIEEQLLVFKQQQSIQVYEEFEIFSQSIQNFNLEFNNPFELSNQVNSLIQQHGFDLKQNITTTLTTEQLNNAKEDQYLTNKEVNNNMNHSIPYELILQSSYHDISLINKKFNTHRISKVYFPNHHLDQHIFQHSGLSYLNLVKSEQLQLQDCYNMIYGQNLQISCEDSFYASNLIQQQNSSYQDYYKKIFAIQEESTFSLDLLQTFLDSNYAINPLNIQSYDTLESSNNIKHYAYMPSYILYPHNYEIIKVYHNNLLASTQQDQSTLCLGELFDQEEKKLPRINFLQNKQISIVSYQGGTIHNNVLIRGMSKHLNQNLQNTLLHHIQNSSLNNEDQIKRLQIALGLLDNTRLFSYAGVYQGFDQNIMKTPQFIINYLLLDNINSTQQIQHIPLEQLLKYCASYELFIYMQVFRQNVTNNLQFSQVNNRFYSAQIDFIITNIQSLQDFSDSAQFSMMFFEKVQLQSLSDRFLPNRFISFFELMITYYFENNPSQAQKCKNLISTPLFYTKMIASDNHLLFLLLCNNKFVKSSQILQQVLIKQQSLISKDVKILQITQFNHFFLSLLRTISINSKAELLEQDQIIISKECISKIQNEIFFDHKFMLPGPKFLDLDQKIFNSQLLYKQISIKKDSSFQKPSSPVKPIKIELKQQHLQISLPSLPFNPQNIAIKQEELQKLSPQVETLKIQTHKLVVQENMNQVLFFDQILLKADRNQVQHAIRRIISHYSCRSYYFKKNLLYVPNVRIISAEDAISHQIGFKVNDYDPKNSSQQNFDILLQILTNDFQLQNKNKTPNIHKFCTVFNEEIKKKLDAVCFLPQLNLEFYKNFNVFSQWIIKRTLQAECDLNRGLMVVFDQDPVMGINLNQKQEWNQLSNKYKFSIFTDSIYSLSDSKALQLYNQLKSECDQYDKEYRDRQLLMLIKIGIGTGSTPLETYYRFIQKDDPYKVSKSLTSFVNLLTLCFEKKLEFPYKVPSVTANMEEFQQSLYRLEHMRFLHIKLQQFDFLQWLSRLSELKASSITIQEKEHIQIIIQRQMCNNITKLYPDYAENLTVEEEKSVKLIGDQASLIDASNQVLWKVDIKFNEFLPENDPKYNMLRHFKLEFFAINDYEQSYVRKAWEITLQYKLLFIALFGTSRQDIERLINQQNGILPLDQQMIEHVFKQIQSLWSRLHDFILMHIITDMGYTEAMMQSIVGKDTRQKSKHVEFLRQGFFVDEESFNITQTPLYYIFVEVKNAIPDTSQQPIILNTATLNEYLSIKQHLVQPTIQQIIKAITILRSKNPDEIFVPISVSKELLTRRVEHIAHALRCERILACDPLQKYLQDKAVSLAPIYPQMKPFIEPKILPVQPVIKIEAEPLQKSMKIKKIPALQIPNVSQILTQKVPNIQFLAPQNESIHPSKLAARVIKNTKLQFYLQPKTEILEFVGDLINNSTHIQNIDVFLITQILQDPTTEWARLYTFLINFQPKPSKYTEIYKKIAVKTGETDSYRIVAKGKQHFELVESFILDQIDAAYSVAYAMRKAIIEGVKCEELKGKIHNNLKIAAIWGQELVFQCLKDKMEYQQKLCLSLYFMLSEEVE